MASYSYSHKKKDESPTDKLRGNSGINRAVNADLFKTYNHILEDTTCGYCKAIAIDAATKIDRTIFLMSNEISEEKIDLIRAFGTDIVILPSSDLPASYQGEGDRNARVYH